MPPIENGSGIKDIEIYLLAISDYASDRYVFITQEYGEPF